MMDPYPFKVVLTCMRKKVHLALTRGCRMVGEHYREPAQACRVQGFTKQGLAKAEAILEFAAPKGRGPEAEKFLIYAQPADELFEDDTLGYLVFVSRKKFGKHSSLNTFIPELVIGRDYRPGKTDLRLPRDLESQMRLSLEDIGCDDDSDHWMQGLIIESTDPLVLDVSVWGQRVQLASGNETDILTSIRSYR